MKWFWALIGIGCVYVMFRVDPLLPFAVVVFPRAARHFWDLREERK